VSERTTKHAKPHKKHSKKDGKTFAPKGEGPVEVLVYDPLLKEKLVASYAGESKWWFSTRMFKVYHPCFEGGNRWVMKLGRVLGPFDPTREYPTARDLEIEKRVIAKLMAP
jgi:hypothetical protein